MAVLAHMIEATKGKIGDTDAALASLKGWKYNSPRGPISIDPDTRDIVMNEYLVEVVKGKRRQAAPEEARQDRQRQGPLQGAEDRPLRAEELTHVRSIANRQTAALTGRRFCFRDALRRRRGEIALASFRASSRANFGDAMPDQPAGGSAMKRAQSARRPISGGSLVNFVVEIANMLLGGLAAGMVLFIVSVGLSVTMGLMGFVNLAHGGFAMIGGYVIVLAMNRLGVPFVAGAGDRLHRHRRDQRRVRAAALFAALSRAPSSTRCCSPSGWSS